jgi:hypothetical protein
LPAAAWADAVASLGQMPQPADPTNFVLDFLPFKDRVVRREDPTVMYRHGKDNWEPDFLKRRPDVSPDTPVEF